MGGKSIDKDDPRQKYLKELRGLIKDVDADGLLFLIKQANTLIYNQRVDMLNQEAEKVSSGRSVSAGKTDTVKREPNSNQPVVIEKGAFGKSFIVDFQTQRKTFGEDEMLRLVQAASAGYTDPDQGASRIYRWLQRNRDDVLLDLGIHSPRSRHLADLGSALKATFRVREG